MARHQVPSSFLCAKRYTYSAYTMTFAVWLRFCPGLSLINSLSDPLFYTLIHKSICGQWSPCRYTSSSRSTDYSHSVSTIQSVLDSYVIRPWTF